MDSNQLLIPGASVLASPFGGSAMVQGLNEPYVRVAEIEIDPAQLEALQGGGEGADRSGRSSGAGSVGAVFSGRVRFVGNWARERAWEYR